MSQETDEGVAYLRSLKQSGQLPAATAVAPAPATGPAARSETGAPVATSGEGLKAGERRRSPRYKCEGSVEMREANCEVRTWATCNDVSLHGCYVEAQATYPVGTVLHMKLETNGISVETKGTVRINYPYLGMGIAFMEMSEENLTRLKQLLRTVSRRSVVMGPGIASSLPTDGPLGAVPLISNPQAGIQTLMEFFETRQILMRDDFLRLLRKSQESPTT